MNYNYIKKRFQDELKEEMQRIARYRTEIEKNIEEFCNDCSEIHKQVDPFILETAQKTINEEFYNNEGEIRPEALSSVIEKLCGDTAILYCDNNNLEMIEKILKQKTKLIYLFSDLNTNQQENIQKNIAPIAIKIMKFAHSLNRGKNHDPFVNDTVIKKLTMLIYLNRNISMTGEPIPYDISICYAMLLRPSIFELPHDFVLTSQDDAGDYWPTTASYYAERIKKEAEYNEKNEFNIEFVFYNDNYENEQNLIAEYIIPIYEFCGLDIAKEVYKTQDEEFCAFVLLLIKEAYKTMVNIDFCDFPRE